MMNSETLKVCISNSGNSNITQSNLKWYCFRQNNSGGYFIRNDTVGVFVLIQAHTAIEANALAERVGIYFNGVLNELDCECCGDRWSQVDEYDGNVEPKIYGELVDITQYFFNGDSLMVYSYNDLTNKL